MIKVKVEYIIELSEQKLDKYCLLTRIGRREAKSLLKEMAVIFGRSQTYEHIDETIRRK